MPEAKLHVTLLRHTLSPEEVVALGARLCYSRATIGDLEQKIAAKDQQAFVERLLNMGHESVLEHASFTFGVEGVSRVLLAQLTRHRLASFSVQSQRYVSYEKGFGYIVPPKIAALGPEAEAEFKAQMEQMPPAVRFRQMGQQVTFFLALTMASANSCASFSGRLST